MVEEIQRNIGRETNDTSAGCSKGNVGAKAETTPGNAVDNNSSTHPNLYWSCIKRLVKECEDSKGKRIIYRAVNLHDHIKQHPVRSYKMEKIEEKKRTAINLSLIHI